MEQDRFEHVHNILDTHRQLHWGKNPGFLIYTAIFFFFNKQYYVGRNSKSAVYYSGEFLHCTIDFTLLFKLNVVIFRTISIIILMNNSAVGERAK